MGHGGKRAGAGRPKNARSILRADAKATLEELARRYTDLALETLHDVAKDGTSEAARVAAATALLDRGYGRPHQTQDSNITMSAGEAFVDLLRMVNERRTANGAVANGMDQPPERPASVRH